MRRLFFIIGSLLFSALYANSQDGQYKVTMTDDLFNARYFHCELIMEKRGAHGVFTDIGDECWFRAAPLNKMTEVRGSIDYVFTKVLGDDKAAPPQIVRKLSRAWQQHGITFTYDRSSPDYKCKLENLRGDVGLFGGHLNCNGHKYEIAYGHEELIKAF